jgi:Na+/glutamate symporter
MSYRISLKGGATSALLVAMAFTTTGPTLADNSGAFVGGMLTSRVLNNMHQRTQAEQEQAYYAQQQSQQQQVQQAAPAAPAASPTQSTEQKLDELNKLAAGGYITPEEYKAKKQSIIDAM